MIIDRAAKPTGLLLLRPLLLAALIIGLSAGCGEAVVAGPPGEPGATATTRTSPTATPSRTRTPDRDGLLIGRGTVLDDGSGPELCLGGVMESLPPQCGGPVLRGWIWPSHGVQRERGTTWGDFAVVGRLSGPKGDPFPEPVEGTAVEQFTVEQTIDPEDHPWPEPEEIDYSTPCPEPSGGWRAPEPDRATAEDLNRVVGAAERLPGYALVAVDDLGAPTQDPGRIVVNVWVTEDLDGADRALRAVWGGSLCVSQAQHSLAELTMIQSELTLPGLLGSSGGRDGLEVTVVFDDGALQRQVDRTYGPGLVFVSSALQPYPA